jgi:CRP-like cAMP-binding protein
MIGDAAMDEHKRPGRPRYTQILNRIVAGARRERGTSGIRIVPFVRGRRPTDEARHPGLGSSDHAALVLGRDAVQNHAYVLFTLAEHDGVTVDATLSFAGHSGSMSLAEIPGWHRRPVELRCFDESGDGSLRAPRPGDSRFVLRLEPERDLWPGRSWNWTELTESVRGATAGDEDPYGLGHLFLQRVRVELRLTGGAVPVSTAQTTLDVCDMRRLGSLYARILERLVKPDVERQAGAAGMESPGHAYHPWFPVLLIGSEKAALYTRALVADIVDKHRYLLDPAWLLRLGVYLELLTCLGIVEAVRDEVGDLLTPQERVAFESEAFAPLRERLDPEAWRGVWALREIAFPQRGLPRAGPVSLRNLLRKKRATLRFLHVHHEDLKHAIELAGPNRDDAQETWQRVFRDAERAVLRQTPAAFPELGYLPRRARDLVLWHRQGRLDIAPTLRVPKVVAALLSDQDGLFPAACNQYRASMNAVAAWAEERSLMNLAGKDCVPLQVSLLEAHMNDPERIATLQRRDGYSDRLDVSDAPDAVKPAVEDVEQLLAGVSIFRMLAFEDRRSLAESARPLALGPMERFLIQDTEGTSLFVVADGEVEIVLRRSGMPDLRVTTLGRGEVIGEMSLLTGEPRAATVRAADYALVYEIGRSQYEPLLRAHREWVDELAAIMEARLEDREARIEAYSAFGRRAEIGRRVLRHFFGGAERPAAVPAD